MPSVSRRNMINIIKQLNDTTYKVTPKDDWKDRIEVEVGDSKQPDFQTTDEDNALGQSM